MRVVRTNTFIPDVFDFFTLNEMKQGIEIVIVLKQDKTRHDKKASCRT